MTANYRDYNPDQMYFTVIDPEYIKNNNPLLLAIHSFIDEHVSVDLFSSEVENELGGAPAVHPKMILKVLFYSYAQGIYSSRKIEERLRWDSNYIYLSANQRVDHSTICNFILQYGEEIKEIFTKLVYVMAKKGYVSMDFVAVDGTKIKANTSKRFTGDIKEFKRKCERIEKKIRQVLQHTLDEEINEKYKISREDKLNALREEKEKIDVLLKEIAEAEGSKKDTIISLTDRDARMVRDKDTKYMGYNCQAGVDSRADVIISADVFNEASDSLLLRPMVENIKKQAKDDLQDTELSFDGGYFSSENLKYCHKERLQVYLPEGRGEGGRKKRVAGGKLESKDCRIECEGEIKRLICPGRQVIETKGVDKKNDYFYYKFYPDKERCRDCILKDKCYKGIKARKSFSVKREYFDTFPLRKQMTEKLSSKRGKRRMAERFWVIEHVFGEIKEILKFRKFLHRSLEKVKLIWMIISTAYNFKKLARLAYG